MILGMTETDLKKLLIAAVPVLFWLYMLWERRR
jgi:hypothetical protein